MSADEPPGLGDVTQPTVSSTGAGGKPGEPVDEQLLDPVLGALARARLIVRGYAGRPGKTARRRGREDGARQSEPGGYSGTRPDRTDPQPVGNVLADYVETRGWQRPLNEARVFSDWAAIVGPDVAAHCAPTALRDGELKVTAESTAWATQLRLLAATLLARLAAELGPELVRAIHIAGPTAPSWKHGRFSVRGTRGPRDTYG